MKVFFEKIYTFITFLTLIIGFIVALLFGLALIIGGPLATELALIASKIITWAIKLAAIAIVFGLIYIYLSKTHTLKMDSDEHKN